MRKYCTLFVCICYHRKYDIALEIKADPFIVSKNFITTRLDPNKSFCRKISSKVSFANITLKDCPEAYRRTYTLSIMRLSMHTSSLNLEVSTHLCLREIIINFFHVETCERQYMTKTITKTIM